jgi:hypothetical protein
MARVVRLADDSIALAGVTQHGQGSCHRIVACGRGLAMSAVSSAASVGVIRRIPREQWESIRAAFSDAENGEPRDYLHCFLRASAWATEDAPFAWRAPIESLRKRCGMIPDGLAPYEVHALVTLLKTDLGPRRRWALLVIGSELTVAHVSLEDPLDMEPVSVTVIVSERAYEAWTRGNPLPNLAALDDCAAAHARRDHRQRFRVWSTAHPDDARRLEVGESCGNASRRARPRRRVETSQHARHRRSRSRTLESATGE